VSSSADINEIYHLVVRHDAVGPRPFVWEVRHKLTEIVFRAASSRSPTWKKFIDLAIPHSNAWVELQPSDDPQAGDWNTATRTVRDNTYLQDFLCFGRLLTIQ
jgi:hypothetical protein